MAAFEAFRNVAYSPDTSSDGPQNRIERESLSDIENEGLAVQMMTAAYRLGATHEDVGELLSRRFVLRTKRGSGIIDEGTVRRRMLALKGAGELSSAHPLRDEYIRFLQAKLAPGDTLDPLRLEEVRTLVRMKRPNEFWKLDDSSRAAAIQLLERIGPKTGTEAGGTAKVADLVNFLQNRFGVPVTYDGVYQAWQKVCATPDALATFITQLKTIPSVLPVSMLESAQTDVTAWLESRASATNEAQWKKDPRACAIVAALLTLPLEAPVAMRRKTVDRVPLDAIVRILSRKLGVDTTRTALRDESGVERDTPARRTAVSAAVLSPHTYTKEEVERYANLARQWWQEDADLVHERTELQAAIFRIHSATALAIRLLETSDLPYRRIARILEERFDIPVTPDQFNIIANKLDGDESTKRNRAATFIREHAKSLDGNAYAHAESALKGVMDLEDEIRADRRTSFPEIAEWFAHQERTRDSREIHTNIVEKDGARILRIYFPRGGETTLAASRENRALLISLIRAARAIDREQDDNELRTVMKNSRCDTVVIFGSTARDGGDYRRITSARLQAKAVRPSPTPENAASEPADAIQGLLSAITAKTRFQHVSVTHMTQRDPQTMRAIETRVVMFDRIDTEADPGIQEQRTALLSYLETAMDEMDQGVDNELSASLRASGAETIWLRAHRLVDVQGSRRREWRELNRRSSVPNNS